MCAGVFSRSCLSAPQLCECYSNVRDWNEVVNWDSRVDALRKQHSEMEGAFKLHCNIEQIR